MNEQDVHRWGSTEHGPEKLAAVASHAKYDLGLRVEACIELLRMKPRNGRRIGITKLVDALALLSPEERKVLLDRMVPTLVEQIRQVPAPVAAGQPVPPDPTYAYKDAAMAMLTYDKAVLVADEGVRRQLTDALVDWSQHDFEHRLENTSQMFGMEQMMRSIGGQAVRGLPQLVTHESTKFDRIAGLVAELGDAQTKEAAAVRLVDLARYTASPAWLDKTKPIVEEANRVSKIVATPAQLQAQLVQYQDEAVTKVFAAIKKIGTRPSIDYCLSIATDKAQSEKRRQAALAALEGRLDRNTPSDIEKVLAVAASDDLPDSVRDLAFQRVGEMPRDQVIGRLYSLFSAPKWKVRWVSASLVLTMSNASQLAEFMAKLPSGPANGFALTEPLSYGAKIEKMPPKDDKTPRSAVLPFLKDPNLAARLTALGYLYANGKASDLPLLEPLRADRTPVPKVDDPEGKWQCEVPKAPDGKETETKDIRTVGEFVQFCVEPAMKGR